MALAATSQRDEHDERDPFRGAVVAGVDGRPEGLDALALADRMASLSAGPLVVVVHYPYAPLGSRALDGPTDGAAAARVLADARRVLGSRPAEYKSVPGSSPGRTLHETAEEHHAGLLVVGSSHRGPAGRLVLGAVTAEALRRAPCAVGVAPRGWAGGARSLARIGVAVDGSGRDAAAFAAAAAVARRVRPPATVRSIHVDAPAERAAGVPPVAADVQLAGEVVDALAAHSARLDLLVMGSRGLGRTGSLVLGSVAARLVGLARCPVLVLPA